MVVRAELAEQFLGVLLGIREVGEGTTLIDSDVILVLLPGGCGSACASSGEGWPPRSVDLEAPYGQGECGLEPVFMSTFSTTVATDTNPGAVRKSQCSFI